MRQETATGDILATGIHLTLEGVGIQELYVTHGPSNGLVSGDEKFHSKSSGADKGESGPEIGVLEEVVPELFRLLERGEMVDIDHYQPRGGDESVALTTGKTPWGVTNGSCRCLSWRYSATLPSRMKARNSLVTVSRDLSSVIYRYTSRSVQFPVGSVLVMGGRK